MRKIGLVLGLLCLPTFAEAATVLNLGNSGSNLNSTIPSVGMSAYYKCTNSVPFSGCQTTAIQITYETQTGGTGTSNSPYILTGCVFVGCACEGNSYLASGGKSCITCATGYSGNTVSSGATQYHRNTSCNYCVQDYYRSGSSCIACPGNGKKDGINQYGITSCCLDVGVSQTDTTGTYTCTSKMCYVS